MAVGKPHDTGSIEKQPRVPGSGLGTPSLGWYGCAHSNVLSRDTGTTANCRAGSRTVPRQWEQSSLESPALVAQQSCTDTALRAPSIFQLSNSHQTWLYRGEFGSVLGGM